MKTIDEIYSEMLSIFAEHTGLEAGAGGDLAVRFYAVAAQIHALYLQAELWLLTEHYLQNLLQRQLNLCQILPLFPRK